jgi:GT2 family glycosyltransferase
MNELKYNRIEVKIPYGLNEDLAGAYNLAMASADTEWVLLLDHDVFVCCNPLWYEILIKVINMVPDDVGLITCVTNYLDTYKSLRHTYPQVAAIPEHSDRIERHIRVAKMLWMKYKYKLEEIKTYKTTGFFMLVKKSIWEELKFESNNRGVAEVDWNYCGRLLEKGYKIYQIPGLYVIHRRGIRQMRMGWQIN